MVADPPGRLADYIISATRQWDEAKLNQCMLPMDLKIIRQIRLILSESEDCWAWHYAKNGIFTVRSCSKLMVDTKLQCEAWLNGETKSSTIKQ